MGGSLSYISMQLSTLLSYLLIPSILFSFWTIWRIWHSDERLLFKWLLSFVALFPFGIGTFFVFWSSNLPSLKHEAHIFRDRFWYKYPEYAPLMDALGKKKAEREQQIKDFILYQERQYQQKLNEEQKYKAEKKRQERIRKRKGKQRLP